MIHYSVICAFLRGTWQKRDGGTRVLSVGRGRLEEMSRKVPAVAGDAGIPAGAL